MDRGSVWLGLVQGRGLSLGLGLLPFTQLLPLSLSSSWLCPLGPGPYSFPSLALRRHCLEKGTTTDAPVHSPTPRAIGGFPHPTG